MTEHSSLPKVYEPKQIEKKWYKEWLKQKSFSPKTKNNNKKDPFVILMPPPNVTGKLHMGHALDHTCQDILVRFKRMQGHETLWIPGQDHAGISTQAAVEKKVFREEGKTKHEVGREQFVKKIWDWKKKFGGEIIEQLQRIGNSCDWDYFTFTMDEIPNRAVKKVFVDWYNRGLIYQANYIIHWDPVLQSAISDAEVEYKDVAGAYYYIQYQLENQSDGVVIATTRPETLLGDTAVAVHPEDNRFSDLIGKKLKVPFTDRLIPIIADDYVDREKGTGCLKVTPGHDFNDFQIGQRHGLETINLLNPDGTLNQNAGKFQNCSVEVARKSIIKELKELGLLIKTEQIIHPVGHGERSGEIVEPMVSKQWFVSVKELAKGARELVEQGEMKFLPQSWENTFYSWMREPKDWCISRQLWWGHRIPVFTCHDCQKQWATEENSPKGCPKCKSSNTAQDPDVLDTWFSSGLFPLSTLGWPDEKIMKEKGFSKYYPSQVLVTSFDIIFFWVARMLMFSKDITGQSPFARTYIHALVRDEQGRKMSKSLGNGLDPIEIIDSYGSDAMRMALAAEAGHNRGINLGPKNFESYRNYINKIWNVYRFLSPFLHEASNEDLDKDGLMHPEKWVLFELNKLTNNVTKNIENCRFDEASSALYSFTYDVYCSWFIEISKPILQSSHPSDAKIRAQRINVLKYSFQNLIALLHPIIPFFTEELWSHLNQNRTLLISESYPEARGDFEQFAPEAHLINVLFEIITGIRNIRSELGVSPKQQVEILVFVRSPRLAKSLSNLTEHFQTLAGVKKGKILSCEKSRPTDAAFRAFEHSELFIPLAELIDPNEQRAKIEKDLEKLQLEMAKLEKKLGNQQFKERAPREVVSEVQGKHAGLLKKHESLSVKLASLSP